jgi:hypothetical protein
MYILLPSAEGATALKNFRNGLTAEIIENLISNLKNQTCVIGLPRMKLSNTLNLNNALQNLGLRSLFNPANADLSLLSSGYGQDPVTTANPSVTHVTPMTSPLPIPQALPQPLPQASPQQLADPKSNDFFIFSRVSENSGRRNYFRYDDKRHGLNIEQWDTGFRIRQIRRSRRSIAGKDRNDAMSSRVSYVMENIANSERNAPKIDDENTRYVNLEENKYRFRNASRTSRGNRRKRQSRPMDESFLRFIQSKNFPSYGLDALRNSANLKNPGLFADEVLHKVEIDVTEKGTEAAAATGVILDRAGNQKRLVADRPFLFFIRHDTTKLIFFWGTVNMPTPNYAVVR